MNPTLLKDLILAGHRVACKLIIGQWKVFLRTNGQGKFQGQSHGISIEDAIEKQLIGTLRSDGSIRKQLTGEYKIVTPLPQLPQVGDTVEVLEICRELPDFDEWYEGKKDMVGNKYKVKSIDIAGRISCWTEYEEDCHNFQTRQVAKCEPEKEQSIQSDEQFGDTIVVNGRTYKSI